MQSISRKKFYLSIIAIIGLVVILGGYILLKNINNLHSKANQTLQEAQLLGDFSKIPQEYKVIRAIDMLGIKAVIAYHKASGEKMAFVDPGMFFKMSKNDIRSNTIDNRLESMAKRFNHPTIKVSSLEIENKSFFKAFDQTVPYVKIRVKLTGRDQKDLEGIIGVAQNPETYKNSVLIAMNESGKFNQEIAENFFDNVKFNQETEE